MTSKQCDTRASKHWRQSGNVWLWRYAGSQRDYPGWHLTADHAGASSLIELLGALTGGEPLLFRTVQLCHPTPSVYNIQGKN